MIADWAGGRNEVNTRLTTFAEASKLAREGSVRACVVSPLEFVAVTDMDALEIDFGRRSGYSEIATEQEHPVQYLLDELLFNAKGDIQVVDCIALCSADQDGTTSFSFWHANPTAFYASGLGDVVFLFDGKPIRTFSVYPEMYGYDPSAVVERWQRSGLCQKIG